MDHAKTDPQSEQVEKTSSTSSENASSVRGDMSRPTSGADSSTSPALAQNATEGKADESKTSVKEPPKQRKLKLDAKPFCPSTSAPPYIPSHLSSASSNSVKPFALTTNAAPWQPSTSAAPYIPSSATAKGLSIGSGGTSASAAAGLGAPVYVPSYAQTGLAGAAGVAGTVGATAGAEGGAHGLEASAAATAAGTTYYDYDYEDDYEFGPDFDDDTLAVGKENVIAYSIFYLYTLMPYHTTPPPGIPSFLDYNLAPNTPGRVSASSVHWDNDNTIAKSASKIIRDPAPQQDKSQQDKQSLVRKAGAASAPAGRHGGNGSTTNMTSAQYAQAVSARNERAAKKKKSAGETSGRRKPYVPLALLKGSEGGSIAGDFAKGGIARTELTSGLREAENRWVPPSIKAKQEAAQKQAESTTQIDSLDEEQRKKLQAEADEAAMQKIIKSVLSVLNKLTPDNFTRLAGQTLEACAGIPHVVGLRQVARVIYEKAISEPKYAGLYAALCAALISADPEWNIKYNADLETLRKQPAPVPVTSSSGDDSDDETDSAAFVATGPGSVPLTLHRCASIGLSSSQPSESGDLQTPASKHKKSIKGGSKKVFYVTAQSYVPAEYTLQDAKLKVPSFDIDLGVSTSSGASTPGGTTLTQVLGRETFKKALLTECYKQLSGEPTNTLPDSISPSFAERPDDTEEDKENKRRARARGTVIFCGELFRRGLMPRHAIYYCLNTMLQSEETTSESEVESLVTLLRTVGSVLDGDPDLEAPKSDLKKKSEKSTAEMAKTATPVPIQPLSRAVTTPSNAVGTKPPLDNGFIRMPAGSPEGGRTSSASRAANCASPFLEGSSSPTQTGSPTGSRSASPIIQPIPLKFTDESELDTPSRGFIDAPDASTPMQDGNSLVYAEALRELFSKLASDANPIVAAAAEVAAQRAAEVAASLGTPGFTAGDLKLEDALGGGKGGSEGQSIPSTLPLLANQTSLSLVGASSPELGALAGDLPAEQLQFMITPSPLLRARVRKQLTVMQQQEMLKMQQQQGHSQLHAIAHPESNVDVQGESPSLFPLEPPADANAASLTVDTNVPRDGPESGRINSARTSNINSAVHGSEEDEEHGGMLGSTPLPLLIRASSEFTAVQGGSKTTGSSILSSAQSTPAPAVSVRALAADIGLRDGMGVGVDAHGRSARLSPQERRAIMDKYFAVIERLTKRRIPDPTQGEGKTKYALDSRLRFMLQDLIDLRNSRWISNGIGPKDAQPVPQDQSAKTAQQQSFPRATDSHSKAGASSARGSASGRDLFGRHGSLSGASTTSSTRGKNEPPSSAKPSSRYAHLLETASTTALNTPAKQFQKDPQASPNKTSTATPPQARADIGTAAMQAAHDDDEWCVVKSKHAARKPTKEPSSPSKPKQKQQQQQQQASSSSAQTLSSRASTTQQNEAESAVQPEAEQQSQQGKERQQHVETDSTEAQAKEPITTASAELPAAPSKSIQYLEISNISVAIPTLCSVTGGSPKLAFYLSKQLKDERDAIMHQIAVRKEQQPLQRYEPDRYAAADKAALDSCEVKYAHLLLDPKSVNAQDEGDSPTSADMENTPMKQMVEEYMDTESVEEVLRCIADLIKYFTQRLYTACINAVESVANNHDTDQDVVQLPSQELLKYLPSHDTEPAENKRRYESFMNNAVVQARAREWMREEGIPLVIYHCVQWAAERRPAEAQASLKLILALIDAKAVTARQLLRGITPIIWILESLEVDCPSAFTSVAKVLASLLLRRSVPWNALLDVLFWAPVDMYEDLDEEEASESKDDKERRIECEQFIQGAGTTARLRIGAGLLHNSIPSELRAKVSARWSANPWTVKLINLMLNEISTAQGGTGEIKRIVSEGSTASIAAAAVSGTQTQKALISGNASAVISSDPATEAKLAASAATSAFEAAIRAKQQAKQALVEARGAKALGGEAGLDADTASVLRLLGADLFLPFNDFKAKLQGPVRMALGL